MEITVDGGFLDDFRKKLDEVASNKRRVEISTDASASSPCLSALPAGQMTGKESDAELAIADSGNIMTIYLFKNGRLGKANDPYFEIPESMSLDEAVKETALVAPSTLTAAANYLYPNLLVDFLDQNGEPVKQAIVTRGGRYGTAVEQYTNKDQTVFTPGGWSAVGGDGYCLTIYPKTSIFVFATLTADELGQVKTIKIALDGSEKQ